MTARLPARLEAQAIIRLVEAQDGFCVVLQRGDADAGPILLIVAERGGPAQLYERMADMAGGRIWRLSRQQTTEKASEFSDYLARRRADDGDVWMLEADVVDAGRLVASLPA